MDVHGNGRKNTRFDAMRRIAMMSDSRFAIQVDQT